MNGLPGFTPGPIKLPALRAWDSAGFARGEL